ncbi:6-phosphogluconolactonase [Nesterenkonia sp. HG001]|uniref:6-phosphogluconolactonase n=1 Tax=Nesterenkonia sp. HG001 TaxID=2983207 RepID=UPI002AC6BB32|nr:6-phosphogluconolactonase [Nesterenkonia sp. HG001]MDZ5078009.1 6-phosphogluconolactonase [Nesterenkonia sp. HG001]
MTVSLNTAAAEPRTELFEDKDSLCRAVAERLVALLRRTVEEEGAAHVVLTGGGAGIGTLAAAAELFRSGAAEGLDLAAVHFWWGDERLLPAGDPERNAQQADEALLDLLVAAYGLPVENIHRMPSSAEAETPAAGAEIYAAQLAAHAPHDSPAGLALPRFAAILLGVGPDGHIASLFPGKASLAVTGRSTVGEEDSPKPPPPRVSLTFDAIHSAHRVWTVVTGEDKADAAKKAFQVGTPVEEIPAKNARGAAETVWHLDRAAASKL